MYTTDTFLYPPDMNETIIHNEFDKKYSHIMNTTLIYTQLISTS